MKRGLKLAALSFVLCLTAAQLVRPDLATPSFDPSRSIWKDPRVDTRVAGVLRRACANCHSHETEWPWYSSLSPVSWMMARHVSRGRAKLNFSVWSGASSNQLEEIYDAIDRNDMPPLSYRLINPKARLSKEDREILRAWTAGKMAQVR